MKKNPLVSIVITCYNYEKYIGESIESAFNQDYKNVEVIVINDGSTDDSDTIIRGYRKKYNFQYVSRKNRGIVATRNEALTLFRGDYLLQLDADDIIPKNYTSELVKVAVNTGAGIVYTDYEAFGAIQDVSSFPEYNFEMLKNGNFIHISCLLSKSALKGREFDEKLSTISHEDWDFFLGLCADGIKAVKCNSVKLLYRMHNGSRNNNHTKFDDRLKYTDVYKYIIEKQNKKHPKEFYYLAGGLFADWYSELDTYRIDQEKKIDELDRQLTHILSSRRYQIADKVGKRIMYTRDRINRVKRRTKSRYQRLINIPKDIFVEGVYKKELKKILSTNKKKAIVLHLYYVDMWPYFSEKIRVLMNSGDYSLYVNVPHRDVSSRLIEEQINKVYPEAIVLFTPNQGRDVLSFLRIAKTLDDYGVDYVLKLHSKRSPQRKDGKDWSDEIISKLTPTDQSMEEAIDRIFDDPSAALIGPAGSYVPLTTYYNDNQPKVHWLLSEIFGKNVADDINANNFNYGFFAGTMFWVRLSSIRSVLNLPLTANNFPSESAQLDGTVAHALERVLAIVPEYSKMSIYEASRKKVKKIPHKTEYIPDWSDFYHVQ